MKLGELIPSPDDIMGAKAVFGPISSHILCFGGRGAPDADQYFSIARGVATRATERPWVIAIGGGAGVRDNLGGKVLNIVRVSGDFGETGSFVDEAEAKRLAQWPVAVVLNDVWRVVGFPHLVSDLGMPDRTILAAAMDGVVRYDDKVRILWERLAEREIELCALPLPANFSPSRTPRFSRVGTARKLLTLESDEGRRLWVLQQKIESSGAVKNAAKSLNAERHDGRFTCEACSFSSADSGMLDAHHPTPLAVGERRTVAAHLMILCPTCHRRAHRKSGNRFETFGLGELQAWIAAGRP